MIGDWDTVRFDVARPSAFLYAPKPAMLRRVFLGLLPLVGSGTFLMSSLRASMIYSGKLIHRVFPPHFSSSHHCCTLSFLLANPHSNAYFPQSQHPFLHHHITPFPTSTRTRTRTHTEIIPLSPRAKLQRLHRLRQRHRLPRLHRPRAQRDLWNCPPAHHRDL